jgi:integrase
MGALIDFGELEYRGNIARFPAPKKEKYVKQFGHESVRGFTDDEIEKAKDFFSGRVERYKGQNIRDYTIFMIGLYTGRRAGDLLHLRVGNVLDEHGNIRGYMLINEQKTGKSAKIPILNGAADVLAAYFRAFNPGASSDPLFPSRQTDKNGRPKAMSVRNLYETLQALRRELRITEPIGTHSMRKTFVRKAMEAAKSDPMAAELVSMMMGHSDMKVTRHYYKSDQAAMDAVYRSVKY